MIVNEKNKKQILGQQTLAAHGWLGIGCSLILFIVFWTGALSLFRAELLNWERLIWEPIPQPQQAQSLATLLKSIDDKQPLHSESTIFVRLPFKAEGFTHIHYKTPPVSTDTAESPSVNDLPWQEASFLPQDPQQSHDEHHYPLADMFYELHHELMIPSVGLYIVGIVTLLFFVTLVAGIVFQWGKIRQRLFQFRLKKNRDVLKDSHNVIGLMSLPYTLMYAFTGCVFALGIVFQAVYAYLLYDGDRMALLADAGYQLEKRPGPIGKAADMSRLDTLITQAQTDLNGVSLLFVAVYNYGDENALLELDGYDLSQFSVRKRIHYQVATGEILYKTTDTYDNAVRKELEVIHQLHYGNFAGNAIKFVYFLLGLAVCYLIVSGNLQWLLKREQQRRYSNKSLTLALARICTLGGLTSVISATAVSFSVARLLSSTVVERAWFIMASWWFVFAFGLVIAAFVRSGSRYFQVSMLLCSVLFGMIPLFDLVVHFSKIEQLLIVGQYDLLVTDVVLLLCAFTCLLFFKQSQVLAAKLQLSSALNASECIQKDTASLASDMT